MRKPASIIELIFYFAAGLMFSGLIGAIFVPRFKPAVYFYPTKPTIVYFKLDKSIKITLDMPKYNRFTGWIIKAYPDGTLKDLQPELTDCTRINPEELGLEYALTACRKNRYPYIYWEGATYFKPLPSSKNGWIVNKSQIKPFLETRLDYIGFNQKEKKDFLDYWVPKLTELEQERFFIYFLQNEVVNKDMPETIKPKPDHLNRIFMVVKTDSIPEGNVRPQVLEKFVRKGFYVIDWGGTILK